MEKITKRNMFESLVAMSEGKECGFERDGEFISVSPEEIKKFALAEIVLLDKKAEKAKERSKAKKAAGDELAKAVEMALSPTTFEPIAVITDRIEGADITTHKVIYRLNALIKEGIAEKKEITLESTGRKVQGYRLCEDAVESYEDSEITD